MGNNIPIRVLVAKPGLDGHDRGAKVLVQAMRNDGMEVIYTGLRQTPEQIIEAAIQYKVAIVCLSCLSGAHNELFPPIVQGLKERGREDILILGGGVIPVDDIPLLIESGITRIFTPGVATYVVIEYIHDLLGR